MALAILGVGIVVLVQLFGMSLRTTKHAEDYTRALIHARSLLEGAYASVEPRGTEGRRDLDGTFQGELTVVPMTTDDGAPYYEMTATVTWAGDSLALVASRTVHQVENEDWEP